jgi:hypothetical protein
MMNPVMKCMYLLNITAPRKGTEKVVTTVHKRRQEFMTVSPYFEASEEDDRSPSFCIL